METQISPDQMAARREQVKLIFEHTKHLTTVVTASLLLIVTFMEKFSGFRHLRILLLFGLGSFVISIVACVIAQAYTIDLVTEPSRLSRIAGVAFLVSYLGFLAGILCLFVFATFNMWTVP